MGTRYNHLTEFIRGFTTHEIYMYFTLLDEKAMIQGLTGNIVQMNGKKKRTSKQLYIEVEVWVLIAIFLAVAI